jgi:hypothetical protein
MQCNSHWEEEDDYNKLKHIDIIFCFATTQLCKKDDDMGVFFVATQLIMRRAEGQQLHVIIIIFCSTTFYVKRKTMTMTC